MTDYAGKNILVCGVARSGIAAALLLKKLGARVTASDNKSEDELSGVTELRRAGVDVAAGTNPDEKFLDPFDMIILSPGIPSDTDFIIKAKKNGVTVISEIELAFSVCAAPVIAVTGTNGKTTTTALIAEIFKTARDTTEALGNIGTAFSSRAYDLTAGDFAVVEVSSFQLENIVSFRPKAAVVLNITPDHLDRHKSFGEYLTIKERIFSNQHESDFLILNLDDPLCGAMAGKARSKTVFFSQKTTPDNGVFIKDGVIVSAVRGYGEVIRLGELKLTGSHLIEDALAGVAAAACLGIPVKNIADALRGFAGVRHRLEYVAEINGVRFYNDSKATNPDAAIKGLAAMDRPTVLICGGYDKNSDFTEFVKLFAGKVKRAVVIGETAEKIIETCMRNDFHNYERAGSLAEAAEKCFAAASPGDAVLLSPACASWDMFRDFEQRGDMFSQLILNSSGACGTCNT